MLNIFNKIRPLLFFFMGLRQFCPAQAPDTQWTRVYYEREDDSGDSIKETKNGYIIAGANWIESQGNYDIYILKIDYGGNVQWSKKYGGPGYDVAHSIYVTNDHGFILTGDAGGMFLLRTRSNGDSIWMQSYPGTLGNAVIEISEGGFVAVGSAGYDLTVLRTNASGDELWHRNYGHGFYNEAYSVCETSDGCFAVVGYTEVPSQGGVNVWLLKIDQSGDTLWTRMYGGDGMDGGDWIETTSDGGFIIAGRSTSFGPGWWNAYLLKVDYCGNTEWSRTYGGSEWDGAASVEQVESGGYYIGGYTFSYSNSVDFYFIKTDSQGNELWSKVVGDPSETEWGLSGVITSDGGYIMAGVKWASDENWYDVFVVKLASDLTGLSEPGIVNHKKSFRMSKNYPNPFNYSTIVEFVLEKPLFIDLTIYDLLGRQIQTLVNEYRQAGTYTVPFDASALSSGVYFCCLEAGEFSETRKMILLK